MAIDKPRFELHHFPMRNPLQWLRDHFASEPRLDNGSFGIHDDDVIDRFQSAEQNLYLVSFPRTGSHWLRMLIELYFERPLLTRTFFYPSREDYLLLHTHDMELTVERPNVLYLYRTPVDTVYSQISYHGESIDNQERVRYWSDLYGAHLDKWLHKEHFTQKKTILRYEGMKDSLCSEFEKICGHFGVSIDEERFRNVSERVTRDLVRQKTQYNDRVLNTNRDAYVDRRKHFRSMHEDLVWETLLNGREHLRSAFSKG